MAGSVQESELEVRKSNSDSNEEKADIPGSNEAGDNPDGPGQAAVTYPERREVIRTMLPLMGFCCCYYIGVIGWGTLLPQYIIARLRANDANASIILDYCNVNESDPVFREEKRLQQRASSISSIASFCGGVPNMFMVLIYSSISDQLGRKVTIAIPYIGGSIVGITIAMIVALDGPLWLYFIANFINGFAGSSSALLAGIFASAADVTTPERRSIAIAVIQGVLGIAMVLSNTLMGLWANNNGYTPPIIFLSILIVSSGAFFFIIRETRPRSQILAARQMGAVRAIKKQLSHMKKTLVVDRRRMKQIIVVVLSTTLNLLAYMGNTATLTLYVLDQPFCWDPSKVGNYHATKVAITMVGTTLVVIFLKRFLSDLTLAMIGGSSFIGFYILTALASFISGSFHDVFMFVALVVGAVSMLPSVALKGLGSSLLSKDEQGAFFGIIAIGEAFSFSFGPVIMNSVYTATVTTMNYFVYFMCAGLLGIMLLLLIMYKIFLSEQTSTYDMTNKGFESHESNGTLSTLVKDE